MKVAHAQSKNKLYELGLGSDNYIFKFDRIVIHGIEYRTELFVAIDSGAKSDDGNIVFSYRTIIKWLLYMSTFRV